MPSSCWATPPSEARLGETPISWIAWCPCGPTTVTFSAQDGRGDLYAGQSPHPAGQLFGEAIGERATSCQPRRAGQSVHEFFGGLGQARVGEQHAEHERHAHRDARAGQQLLHRMGAQAPAVQEQQHRDAYCRRSWG